MRILQSISFSFFIMLLLLHGCATLGLNYFENVSKECPPPATIFGDERTKLDYDKKLSYRQKKLIDIANTEWDFFGRQTIIGDRIIKEGNKETEEGYWQRVETYWREGVNYRKTGKDTDWPWSAAFISWIMKKAGAGKDFPYSARHSSYIAEFIKNRKRGNCEANFLGYKTTEYSPQPGDLVCYARKEGVSYETRGKYPSHCDLVVKAEASYIEVVGGNVNDSITKKILNLNEEGLLEEPSEQWFVVILNQL